MRGPSSVNSSVCVDKLSRKEIVQFFSNKPKWNCSFHNEKVNLYFHLSKLVTRKKDDEIKAIQRTLPAFGGCLSLFMNKDHQE